ncbi:hypothetical protein FOZ63_016310 [Perkinsus olseni]|uniref:C2H2-type domain-containing protein n=1 Tax=Perkinsus olseni TaxID=32597 RepID=A0A7J6RSG4_PEROL|nr:hypothetical protein FOZ63_016310 [Perkinsus olseni]
MEGESTGGNIDGHLGMLRPVDEEEFKCEECGKEFVDGRALGQHQLFCGDRKGRDRGHTGEAPPPPPAAAADDNPSGCSSPS